ncbi:MAG TPA: type II toxin-antitoxin system VapC family toxin [Bryobacteraceae bacterium]|nr:type II toxin-antitoxin system VapC family toxin [Bryobacteraceae bacterium]
MLLDTHVVIRWLSAPRKLSREQSRLLDEAIRHGERIGVSAITFLEIALLAEGHKPIAGLHELLDQLDTNPAFKIFPLASDIAQEVAALGDLLRDPADRVIVATARIHRLRLLTSDQRIVQSNLVPCVE